MRPPYKNTHRMLALLASFVLLGAVSWQLPGLGSAASEPFGNAVNGPNPASAQSLGGRSEPGTLPSNGKGASIPNINAAVTPVVTETGNITLSIDGLGTNAGFADIQVQKPAGATVRRAFMAAATTGNTGRVLAVGDVKINGSNVIFTMSTPSSISSFNYFGDVTSIVKPIVDAAPPGIVSLTISENLSPGIDGEILAVIFDDPNQLTSNSVVILFGAQNVAGDTFSVLLAQPISDTTAPIDLSLGISFGFQTPPTIINQVSLISVNGTRLTSSAGGSDDSDVQPGDNGSLLTVGGIGDTNANPADPFSPPIGSNRYDDELYDLRPFVSVGTSTISVFTQNPSNDDNIFFAAFFFKAATAIVGEGIVLGPPTATNPLNTPHTVTATLQNGAGSPLVGRAVNFAVTSGPNAGLTGMGTTNGSGQATFTYSSSIAGTDTIVASFVNSQQQTVTSNPVTKTWGGGGCTVTCPANITRANDPNQCGAVVTYPAPTASAGCGTVNCSPASGSFFPVGTTTVTCSTTAGPVCTFTIGVNSNQPLTLTCPANLAVVTDQTVCTTALCVVVNYPAPVVSNNCSGVNVVCNPPSGTCFPTSMGVLVQCTATDASGNMASCSFTVTPFDTSLEDDSDPSIILLWNSFSGQYRFCCNGVTFTGVGKATIQGCVYTLQHNPADRRVLGRVDKAVHSGTASIQAPSGITRCTITDRNTLNDPLVPACQ